MKVLQAICWSIDTCENGNSQATIENYWVRSRALSAKYRTQIEMSQIFRDGKICFSKTNPGSEE